MALQASPEFKGIKTGLCWITQRGTQLQASPEFKGIKTLLRALHCMRPDPLQASPEFKGIKTLSMYPSESIGLDASSQP